MRSPELRLHASSPAPAPVAAAATIPIGRHLVDAGLLTSQQLLHGLERQIRLNAPLGEILVADGLVNEGQILEAVARQHRTRVVDLGREAADPELPGTMPAEFWLRHRVIPWRRFGRTLVVATARPDRLGDLRRHLGDPGLELACVVAPDCQIMEAVSRHFSSHLAIRAETRVDESLSCRTWRRPSRRARAAMMTLAGILAGVTILQPLLFVGLLTLLAIFGLIMIALLKISALAARISARLHQAPPPVGLTGDARLRLPKVTVMVPLFHETEIAGALVRRLQRLSYPKALLEVILVLEERDRVTRATLAGTRLPAWIRVIEVPDNGSVTTKPRALNYALDFCRGEIIGVWDAEDAPAPDQIEQVAAHFSRAPEDVVCLQGILDFYNPRSNWISRCFTIEYASWWRVILPGIARMGMVIPLGGTTLFFRRAALETLGGWDAHNVTEDADLGVRLARFGMRTEMIETVTHEEANHRVWPWVRQRSRWLKGFMITYTVHMRSPRRLLRDIGWRRFLGLQAFFVGTITQFLFTPLLWSFWMIPFGFPHPVLRLASPALIHAAASAFLLFEIANLIIGWVAVSGRAHRFLSGWVLLMPVYFPIGALAAAKALSELATRPFYWDKTQHGQAPPDGHDRGESPP